MCQSLARVRAEVERRLREHEEKKYDWAASDHFWGAKEDKEILSFIDKVMQEETPAETIDQVQTHSDREKIKEEVERLINREIDTYTRDSLNRVLSFIDSMQEGSKFKIGDIVVHKDDVDGTYYTNHRITNVTELGYILENGRTIEPAHEDDWILASDNFKRELDDFMVEQQFPINYDENILKIVKHMVVWQKAKDKERFDWLIQKERRRCDDERRKAFDDGLGSMYEYLNKNSIECNVLDDGKDMFTDETWDDVAELLRKIGAKAGDKVRLIIRKIDKS